MDAAARLFGEMEMIWWSNQAKALRGRIDGGEPFRGFVPFENGRPVSGPQEFLRGWMLDPKKTEVWGRPVGILQLRDGSLLISDDGGKKIWRIIYSG